MTHFIILLFLAFSDGFILDSSNGNPTSIQTEQHILSVIDLVVEEKRLRSQLDGYVTQLKNSHDQLQNQVNALSTSLNLTKMDNQRLSTKLQKLTHDQNVTDSNVHIMKAQLHKAYLTACTSSGRSLSSGATIVFPTKKTASGINRVSSFTSSGTLTAEEGGVYLISVTVRSRTSTAYYNIYKNSTKINQVYIGSWYSSTYYETGTSVITLELDVGDTIKVTTGMSMYVEAPESCITIIKIK